ncbi:hypothetical protein LSH36_253g00027 [Paralvinella palmiformis]|uniref:Uncharacterized protein n=1 Tax=Paralvinella palmiformis TaxID=53620 RepID=A0AAD9JLK7_9ANNE|nr:hypothetical protein LSH36_253g00027 [Paralvinella palmiformis]
MSTILREYPDVNILKESVLLKTEHNCHEPLGVANSGLIPFYWLHGSDGFAYRGRLNKAYAWISTKPLYSEVNEKDPKQYSWLQTQGNPADDNWVTWYSLYYSDNCEIFRPMIDPDGYITRFHGNDDCNTTASAIFRDPVVTRCVRIVPLMRHGNRTALRIELLGCDVRVCREAIITHLSDEITFQNVSRFEEISSPNSSIVEISESRPHSYHLKPGENFVDRILTLPTRMTRGYAEFKFAAEQIVFGMVLYAAATRRQGGESQFIVTYSRNCDKWEAVREIKRVGDPLIFRESHGRYKTSWHTFPYPILAQCVRVIRKTTRYTSKISPIKAHFIGCGISHTCGLQKRMRRQKRVIGGLVSGSGQWPWLVSIQIKEHEGTDFYHVCGGTLIHPQMFENVTLNETDLADPDFLDNIRIVLGEHSLTLTEDTDVTSQVDKIITHEHFNRTFYIHDMAVLKLERPVRLTDHVTLVCATRDLALFSNDSDCRVVGWGRTNNGFPSRPHDAVVHLFTREQCQNIFSHLHITEDMLCAGHLDGRADACFGDSGGPLVCEHQGRWYQVGVVSWNIGCAMEGYPGVYSSVPDHLDWLQDILEDDQSDNPKRR